MKEVLYATGTFEIGDQFYDEKGQLRTVTDVLICHYLKRGQFRVRYEVDDNGAFIELRLQGFGELPTKQKQPAQKHAEPKRILRMYENRETNPPEKPQNPFFGGGE